MSWGTPFRESRHQTLNQHVLNDFVVIDVETTGLSPQTCSIIQLSAVHYRNQNEHDFYSTHINPLCRIPQKITELTGIDNSMVSDAPTFKNAEDSFFHFIEQAPLLTGYNFSFDLRFLSAASGIQMAEKFCCVDTMDLTKQAYPYLGEYKLCDISKRIGFTTQFHDSLNDCRACGEVLNYICNHVTPENISMHYCTSSGCCPSKSPLQRYRERQNNKDYPIDVNLIVPDGKLLNKRVVFTGLLSFGRGVAKDMAQRAGAQIKTSVSRKTDYLIVGEQDCQLVGADGHSNKEETAYHLINECGANIQIIHEPTFLRLLCREEDVEIGAV